MKHGYGSALSQHVLFWTISQNNVSISEEFSRNTSSATVIEVCNQWLISVQITWPENKHTYQRIGNAFIPICPQ